MGGCLGPDPGGIGGSGWAVSRPRPRGRVGGVWPACVGPDPGGRLGGLARGAPDPHPGGVPGPHPGGVQAQGQGGCPGPGWGCIPACTEADPPPQEMATAAGGMPPTGMHSCSWYITSE